MTSNKRRKEEEGHDEMQDGASGSWKLKTQNADIPRSRRRTDLLNSLPPMITTDCDKTNYLTLHQDLTKSMRLFDTRQNSVLALSGLTKFGPYLQFNHEYAFQKKMLESYLKRCAYKSLHQLGSTTGIWNFPERTLMRNFGTATKMNNNPVVYWDNAYNRSGFPMICEYESSDSSEAMEKIKMESKEPTGMEARYELLDERPSGRTLVFGVDFVQPFCTAPDTVNHFNDSPPCDRHKFDRTIARITPNNDLPIPDTNIASKANEANGIERDHKTSSMDTFAGFSQSTGRGYRVKVNVLKKSQSLELICTRPSNVKWTRSLSLGSLDKLTGTFKPEQKDVFGVSENDRVEEDKAKSLTVSNIPTDSEEVAKAESLPSQVTDSKCESMKTERCLAKHTQTLHNGVSTSVDVNTPTSTLKRIFFPSSNPKNSCNEQKDNKPLISRIKDKVSGFVNKTFKNENGSGHSEKKSTAVPVTEGTNKPKLKDNVNEVVGKEGNSDAQGKPPKKYYTRAPRFYRNRGRGKGYYNGFPPGERNYQQSKNTVDNCTPNQKECTKKSENDTNVSTPCIGPIKDGVPPVKENGSSDKVKFREHSTGKTDDSKQNRFRNVAKEGVVREGLGECKVGSGLKTQNTVTGFTSRDGQAPKTTNPRTEVPVNVKMSTEPPTRMSPYLHSCARSKVSEPCKILPNPEPLPSAQVKLQNESLLSGLCEKCKVLYRKQGPRDASTQTNKWPRRRFFPNKNKNQKTAEPVERSTLKEKNPQINTNDTVKKEPLIPVPLISSDKENTVESAQKQMTPPVKVETKRKNKGRQWRNRQNQHRLDVADKSEEVKENLEEGREKSELTKQGSNKPDQHESKKVTCRLARHDEKKAFTGPDQPGAKKSNSWHDQQEVQKAHSGPDQHQVKNTNSGHDQHESDPTHSGPDQLELKNSGNGPDQPKVKKAQNESDQQEVKKPYNDSSQYGVKKAYSGLEQLVVKHAFSEPDQQQARGMHSGLDQCEVKQASGLNQTELRPYKGPNGNEVRWPHCRSDRKEIRSAYTGPYQSEIRRTYGTPDRNEVRRPYGAPDRNEVRRTYSGPDRNEVRRTYNGPDRNEGRRTYSGPYRPEVRKAYSGPDGQEFKRAYGVPIRHEINRTYGRAYRNDIKRPYNGPERFPFKREYSGPDGHAFKRAYCGPDRQMFRRAYSGPPSHVVKQAGSKPDQPKIKQEASRPDSFVTKRVESWPDRKEIKQADSGPDPQAVMQGDKNPVQQEAMQEDSRPNLQEVMEEDKRTDLQEAIQEEGRPDQQEVMQEDRRPDLLEVMEEDGRTDLQEAIQEDSRPDLQEVMEKDSSPVLQEVMQENCRPDLQEVMQEDSSPDLQEAIQEDSRPNLQEVMEKDSRPVLQEVMQENCRPDLQEVMQEDSRPDLQEAIQEDSRPNLQEVMEKDSSPVLQEVMQEGCRPDLQEVMEEDSRPDLQEAIQEDSRPDLQEVMEKDRSPVLQEVMQEGRRPDLQEVMQEDSRPDLQEAIQEDSRPDLQEVMEKDSSPVLQEVMQEGCRPDQQEVMQDDDTSEQYQIHILSDESVIDDPLQHNKNVPTGFDHEDYVRKTSNGTDTYNLTDHQEMKDTSCVTGHHDANEAPNGTDHQMATDTFLSTNCQEDKDTYRREFKDESRETYRQEHDEHVPTPVCDKLNNFEEAHGESEQVVTQELYKSSGHNVNDIPIGHGVLPAEESSDLSQLEEVELIISSILDSLISEVLATSNKHLSP